jgi:hypothetical protein
MNMPVSKEKKVYLNTLEIFCEKIGNNNNKRAHK